MSGSQWQCINCGHQMDGYLSYAPELCPECGDTVFEDAAEAEKREADNRAINKHDEMLEDLKD